MASGLHRPDRELETEIHAHCLEDVQEIEVHTVQVPSREFVNLYVERPEAWRDRSGANRGD